MLVDVSKSLMSAVRWHQSLSQSVVGLVFVTLCFEFVTLSIGSSGSSNGMKTHGKPEWHAEGDTRPASGLLTDSGAVNTDTKTKDR